MKVADIEDLELLNNLVAECRGWKLRPGAFKYEPTTEDAQTMELIRGFKIWVGFDPMTGEPVSRIDAQDKRFTGRGPTVSIAVCKTLILSVMGEEVPNR